jgi:excinuclease ABC subunit A
VVITGLSGSGKSSLAFDTLYAEGQRRYVESLSAYARQFLQLMEKPDVDLIEGLSPAISIEQKATSHNPRSTVGTSPRSTTTCACCSPAPARRTAPTTPAAGGQSVSQMVDHVLALPEDTKLMILAPVVATARASSSTCSPTARAGLRAPAVDGRCMTSTACPSWPRTQAHHRRRGRPAQGAPRHAPAPGRELRDRAAMHAEGRALAVEMDTGKEHLFSAKFACPVCNYALRNWNRACSPSTTRWAPARSATAWARSQFFDPARVVAYPHLSLAAGAIKGWDRRNQFYFQMLESLAAHYGFDIDTPFEELPRPAAHRAATARARRRSGSLPLGTRKARVTAAPLRGHHPQPRAPLPRDRLDGGARGTGESYPQQQALPRLRRHAPAPRGAPRLRRRRRPCTTEVSRLSLPIAATSSTCCS